MPLYGPDISGYQPGIDLSVLPCDFVGIYISGGTTSGNADGRRQVQQAIAEGKRIVLYHFENDGTPGTPAAEAAWFLTMADYVGPLPANTLYALDNETGNARNVPWQADWLNAVRAAKGRGVGMYAPYTNIVTGIYQPLRDAGFFIWESAYVLGSTPIYGYQVPGGRAPIPGGDPAIWQFTSSGHLTGWAGLLDLNVFFGTTADWDTLAGAIGPDSNNITPLEDGMSFGPTDPVFTSKDGVAVSLQDILNSIDAKAEAAKADVDGVPSFITDVRGDLANKGQTLANILAAETDPAKIAAAIPADIAQQVVTELAKRLQPKP